MSYEPLAEFTNVNFSGLATIGKMILGVGVLFCGLSLFDRRYRRQGLLVVAVGLMLVFARSILLCLI